jgi:hypothetical protein
MLFSLTKTMDRIVKADRSHDNAAATKLKAVTAPPGKHREQKSYVRVRVSKVDAVILYRRVPRSHSSAGFPAAEVKHRLFQRQVVCLESIETDRHAIRRRPAVPGNGPVEMDVLAVGKVPALVSVFDQTVLKQYVGNAMRSEATATVTCLQMDVFDQNVRTVFHLEGGEGTGVDNSSPRTTGRVS